MRRLEEQKASDLPVVQATLPEVTPSARDATRQHRKRVLKTLLTHGIPVNKVEGDLKRLFEEARPQAIPLGHKSDLSRNFMRELVTEQQALLKDFVAGRNISFFADGSPRFAEACLIGVRVCSDEFDIEQKILRFSLFNRPLTGEEWATIVFDAFEEIGIRRRAVRFGMTDRAGVNGVMARRLTVSLPMFIHAPCIPHALDKIPKLFSLSLLKDFMKLWNKVFSKSHAARSVFYSVAKEMWKAKHAVRWSSRFYQHEQVLRVWTFIPEIILRLKSEKLCVESVKKFETSFTGNDAAYSDLGLELRAAVDASRPFVVENLFLQGDGFLSPFTYVRLKQLVTFAATVCASETLVQLPNVFAALSVAPDFVPVAAKRGAILIKLRPGFEKTFSLFREGHIDETGLGFGNVIKLFRFARFFHPETTLSLLPVHEQGQPPLPPYNIQKELDNVLVAKCVADVVGLSGEFERLVALYAEHQRESGHSPTDLLAFWKQYGSRVPCWAAAAKIFVLLQPNSCAAERGFSVWRKKIDNDQASALQDLQELTVQLGFG